MSNIPNRVYGILDELASNYILDYREFVEFERNGLEHHFDKIRELGAKLKKAENKSDFDLYDEIADEIVTIVKRANGNLEESKKSARKSIKEEYDPTDDIINKGNSVGMDYETFLEFAEKQDYKFNVTDATFYFGINSNIKIEGKECSCIPSEDGILIIDNHSSIEIPRKDIDIVEGVSLSSKNVLRMDICTKDGDVLTVWWEL